MKKNLEKNCLGSVMMIEVYDDQRESCAMLRNILKLNEPYGN